MINFKSAPEDIIHYKEQIKLLLLSDKEKAQINQILDLNKIIQDDSIKNLIKEDLKDNKWLEDTKILINTCVNKIEKTMSLQKHIEDCDNFLIYRYLENKCSNMKIEVSKQITGWLFNEINNKEERSKWASKKFLDVFEKSNIAIEIISLLKENNKIEIDLKWLYKNRDLFYNDDIFLGINNKKVNINERV